MTVMPLKTDLLEGLLHLVELERLDDRLDLLHPARTRIRDCVADS